MFRTFIVFCMLAVPTLAVINTNTKSESKIERRQVPFETYGPPPIHTQQAAVLPTPIYGVPAQANYPPPPPDKLPKEYGRFRYLVLTILKSVYSNCKMIQSCTKILQ